jgi:hypothetical protein
VTIQYLHLAAHRGRGCAFSKLHFQILTLCLSYIKQCYCFVFSISSTLLTTGLLIYLTLIMDVDPSEMTLRNLRQELESLGIDTRSFLEKSEFIDALVTARKGEFLDPSTDYTVLEDLGEMGQPFLMPPDFRNLTCTCCASNDNNGSVIVECEHVGKPKSLFRPMGGHLSFLGSLQMPNGTYRKMDDPRDYLVPESESYPGHTMTIIEIL